MVAVTKVLRRGWLAIPRVVRWVLVAAPATIGVGLLVLNLALLTGLVERLVSGSYPMATVHLRTGRAWMWWPTRLHLRDVELEIDAYRYQLHVTAADAEADIVVFDLLSRTLHTRSLEVPAAELVLLIKVPPGREDDARLEQFPSVGSFGRPVRDAEVPELPAEDDALKVRLEGIDAGLTRLGINEFDLACDGSHVTGEVRATAGHSFGLSDLVLELAAAEVRVGDHGPVAELEPSRVRLDVVDFDPFEVTGQAVLSQVSAEVGVAGMVHDVAFAAMYLPDWAGGVALGGGKGHVEVRATVDAGQLQPGARLAYETEAMRVYFGELVMGTGLELVVEADKGPRPHLRVGVDARGVHGGVAGKSVAKYPLRADKVEFYVDFDQRDLAAAEWPVADLRVATPALVVDDLAVLDSTTKGVQWLGGAAELAWATTRLDDGRYGHDAKLKLADASVRTAAVAVRASGTVAVGARTEADWGETVVRQLAVHLRDVALHTDNGQSDGTWLRITGGEVTVRHTTGAVHGRVQGRLDDLRPVFEHARAGASLRERVPDYDLTTPIDFDLGLVADQGGLTVEIHRFARPALEVRGRIRRVEGRTRFALLLPRAAIGLSGGDGSDLDVDVAVGDEWLASKQAWVDGAEGGG